MTTTIDWTEVAVRLLLTAGASALIGLNRGEQGRPAGLRTMILVGVAAAVSMIQVNLLLDTAGRKPDSFIMLDLMRLPLGILSGMGFIGAGTILRRGKMIQGVTTAATLWFVTVMGLCFGGGQLALGITMLALGLFVLGILHWVDQRIVRDRSALLILTVAAGGPTDAVIRESILADRLQVVSCSVTIRQEGNAQTALPTSLARQGRSE